MTTGGPRSFTAVAAPLVLLAALIALVAVTQVGLDLSPPAPIEQLVVERTVLSPGVIQVHVRNAGPAEVSVALVSVNDSIWPATASPSETVSRLGTATLTLHYPWVEGEAYEIALITSNAVVFHTAVTVAFSSPQPTLPAAASYALIGLSVGLLPIAIGMLWLPAMRRASRHVMLLLLALTAGILAVLGVDTLAEALEQSAAVPGPFQGLLLVGLGTVGTYAGLAAVSMPRRVAQRAGDPDGWTLAYLIALGIGLHNLGEGLAIGAAYAVGEVALGAFLVIGFILQNVTEGVAIVVPILRKSASLRHLGLLALIGGAPAIVGILLGAFTYSVVFATLFLAVGAGAIAQVLVQISRLAVAEAVGLRAPFLGLAGALAGFALLYVTGLLIK